MMKKTMKNKSISLLVLTFLLLLQGCFRINSGEDTTSKATPKKSTFQKEIFKLNSVEDLYRFLTYDENCYPIISAHRGGAVKGYPENAIESFANIADHMPAIIECDVRLSKDSVMVLMHDENIDRSTNGTGAINDYTIHELKQFRLKDSERNLTDYQIPTLEEALAWGAGKVIFTLDIKKGVSYQKMAELIGKTNAQAYSVIITYSANQAIALHRIAPELMISVSIKSEKDLQRLYNAGIPDNRLVAFVGTRQPDRQLVEAIHSHGIKIILGTLGNLDRQADSKGYQTYAEFIENGADIISTDRPFEAFKALDFYVRKRGISSPFINQ